MNKDQIAERAAQIAKDSYAIFRGQFKDAEAPPHWDNLSFQDQLSHTFTASQAYWFGRTEAR